MCEASFSVSQIHSSFYLFFFFFFSSSPQFIYLLDFFFEVCVKENTNFVNL